MLDREVVVTQVLAVLLGPLGDVVEFAIQPRFATAVRLRQLVDRDLAAVPDHSRRLTEFRQHAGNHRALLRRQRNQEVIRGEFRIRVRFGLIDRSSERLLSLDRPFFRIERHTDRLRLISKLDTYQLNFHEPSWRGESWYSRSDEASTAGSRPAAQGRICSPKNRPETTLAT